MLVRQSHVWLVQPHIGLAPNVGKNAVRHAGTVAPCLDGRAVRIEFYGPETTKPIARSALVLSSIRGALPLLLIAEDLIELGIGLGLLVDLLDLFLALLLNLILQLLEHLVQGVGLLHEPIVLDARATNHV